MAQILGGIIGVYLFSILINFITKKIRHSESTRQRLIITLIVAISSIIINTSNLRSLGVGVNEILDGVFIYILGAIVTSYLFALKLRNKAMWLSFLYIVVFWFIISSVVSLLVYFIGIADNMTHILIGMFSVIIGAIISPILVIKQKLPFTKKLAIQPSEVKDGK